MTKRSFKKFICLALAAVMTILSSTVAVKAASDRGSEYIDSTYGSLIGRTEGTYHAAFLEKVFSSYAETTNAAVPRIRASLEVQYATSGNTIGTKSSNWVYNSNYASTGDMGMRSYTNQETGKCDGFVNTICVAHGTADAIVYDAYVVYTRTSY